jgi:hypothetical protein
MGTIQVERLEGDLSAVLNWQHQTPLLWPLSTATSLRSLVHSLAVLSWLPVASSSSPSDTSQQLISEQQAALSKNEQGTATGILQREVLLFLVDFVKLV